MYSSPFNIFQRDALWGVCLSKQDVGRSLSAIHQVAINHWGYGINECHYLRCRDTKSQNFLVGRISCAKTFQTECVNRFRDIYAAKVRRSLLRHIFVKSA